MKSKIQDIKNLILEHKNSVYAFIGMVFFSFIVCTNFLRIHFAADTYCLYAYGYDNYILHFLASARFFGALELWIAKILDITLLTNLKILSFIGIIIAASAWYILYKYILKLMKKEKSISWNILIGTLTFSIIFNFSSCEMFMFAESGIMMFAILLSVIGACVFNSEVKHRYIISFILVLLSSFAYQSTISLFVLLALIMETYRNKGDIKKIVKEALIIGIFYGSAFVINLISIKIIQIFVDNKMRKASIPSINDIIYTTYNFGTTMMFAFKLLPKYLYVAIIGLITLWYILIIFKTREKFSIIEYIMLGILAFFMPLLPVMATPREQQYIEPRMVLSYAAIIPILILYIAVKFEEKKINWFKQILAVASIRNGIFKCDVFYKNIYREYCNRIS